MTKSNSNEFQLDMNSINKAVIILRAYRNNIRQRILALLRQNQNLTVIEIYEKLKMDQPSVSMHLAILRRAGIVNTYK